MSKFISLLKKDITLIFSLKFMLLILSPLILYSIYINYVYIKQDVNLPPVYLIENIDRSYNKDNLELVDSIEYLEKEVIDKEGIGINFLNQKIRVSLSSSSNKRNDELAKRFALIQAFGKEGKSTYKEVGKYTREEKLRREMTCEILFFEMVAIVFMAASASLFKEKEMGVLKVYKTLPANYIMFFLSKTIIFTFLNFLVAMFLIVVNIGYSTVFTIMAKAWIDIGVISIIMIIVSHLASFIFKNFKQFGLSYAFIMIFLTSPVFLAANTPLHWNWIDKYPIYKMYMSLKDSFFDKEAIQISYLVGSMIAIVGLVYLLNYVASKKLGEV